MKILLITSLYPDDSPVLTTSAVHDLVKYWSKNNEVVCFKEEWVSIVLNKKKRVQIKKIGGYIDKKGKLMQLQAMFCTKHTNKDSVDVYRFTCLSPPFSKGFYQIKKLFYIIMAFKMNRVLKRIDYKPDVVIVHMPMKACILYLPWLKLECPKFAILHRGDVSQLRDAEKGRPGKTNKIDLLNENFTAVFSRSFSIYSEVRRMGMLKNLREDIVHSGIPYAGIRTKSNWNSRFRILFVGDLIAQKGVDVILKSLSAIQKLEERVSEFCIIGDGPEKERLVELTAKLKLDNLVSFKGRVSREEVYKEMLLADIFVMPAKHETLGLVYLEAMSNGCITIGSRNEGIDGIIIDGENGFLVKALDDNELSDKLEKIFGMSVEVLERISKKAIEKANFHNLEDMSVRYLDIVEREMRGCKEG